MVMKQLVIRTLLVISLQVGNMWVASAVPTRTVVMRDGQNGGAIYFSNGSDDKRGAYFEDWQSGEFLSGSALVFHPKGSSANFFRAYIDINKSSLEIPYISIHQGPQAQITFVAGSDSEAAPSLLTSFTLGRIINMNNNPASLVINAALSSTQGKLSKPLDIILNGDNPHSESADDKYPDGWTIGNNGRQVNIIVRSKYPKPDIEVINAPLGDYDNRGLTTLKVYTDCKCKQESYYGEITVGAENDVPATLNLIASAGSARYINVNPNSTLRLTPSNNKAWESYGQFTLMGNNFKPHSSGLGKVEIVSNIADAELRLVPSEKDKGYALGDATNKWKEIKFTGNNRHNIKVPIYAQEVKVPAQQVVKFYADVNGDKTVVEGKVEVGDNVTINGATEAHKSSWDLAGHTVSLKGDVQIQDNIEILNQYMLENQTFGSIKIVGADKKLNAMPLNDINVIVDIQGAVNEDEKPEFLFPLIQATDGATINWNPNLTDDHVKVTIKKDNQNLDWPTITKREPDSFTIAVNSKKPDEPTNPDNGGKDPSKPDDGGKDPSKPDDGGKDPSKPDDGGKDPSKPDNGGKDPSKPDNGGKDPSKPDNGGKDPSKPDNGGKDPSKPDYGGKDPSKPDNGGKDPSKPDNGGKDPSKPDNNAGSDNTTNVIVAHNSAQIINERLSSTPEGKQLYEQIGDIRSVDTDAGKLLQMLKTIDKDQIPLVSSRIVQEGVRGGDQLNGPISMPQILSEVINTNADGIITRMTAVGALGAGDDDNVCVSEQVSNLQVSEVITDKPSLGVWISPFYNKGKQKKDGDISGYKLRGVGAIAGVDYQITDDLLIGIAYSGFETKTSYKDLKDGDKSNTRVNIFSLYGRQYFTPTWYIEGIASYSRGKIKNKEGRIILQGMEVAEGKYTLHGYTGQITTGYTILCNDNVTLTPLTGIRYSKLRDKGYKEQGTSFQNLTVKKKSYDIVELLAGFNLINRIELSQMMLFPSVNAMVNYKVKGSKISKIDVRLDGIDNPLPVRLHKLAKMFLNVGAGLTAKTQDHKLEFGIQYNAILAKKYVGHQGIIKLKFNM